MKMWFLVVFIMGADGVTPEVTGQTFAIAKRVFDRRHDGQDERPEAGAGMGLQPDREHGRGRAGRRAQMTSLHAGAIVAGLLTFMAIVLALIMLGTPK